MNVQLTPREVRKILKEKFGDGQFSVFYTETDAAWEGRTGKSIADLAEPPDKKSLVVYFNED